MSDNAIWITVLSSTLVAVLGVATFFIQKWIASVDETIKEHNTVIYKVSSQVNSFQSVQSRTTEDITHALREEIGRIGRNTNSGIAETRQDIAFLKDTLFTKVIPQLNETKIQLGKVHVIEKNQDEQGKAVTKLYDTLKLVIEKLPRQK